MTSPPRAWAEIDLSALDHNLAFAQEHSDQKAMAILKAGAYGHGLVKLAQHLDDQGLPYFGVANVHEAQRLKESGIKTPIYLLGPAFPEEREEIVNNGWTPCLSSLAEIHHYQKLAESLEAPVHAHLALDTGMGRGGFLPDQLTKALQELERTPALVMTGIGSHLPSADEDRAFTHQQFEQFDTLIESHAEEIERLSRRRGLPYFHLSNSAGLLNYQSRTTNMVRPGLLLYGVSPLPEWQEQLRPVMTLKSRISLIRTLPRGHGVSYGRTHILEKETPVATIGVGYGDGYPRALDSKHAYVLIKGQKATLLGRVTMDQIMVDVSCIPNPQPGDEVELFGSNLPVNQIAKWSQTIAWEVLTRITPRVTRHYRNNLESKNAQEWAVISQSTPRV